MGVRVSRGVCWTNPMVEKQESRESEFLWLCAVCVGRFGIHKHSINEPLCRLVSLSRITPHAHARHTTSYCNWQKFTQMTQSASHRTHCSRTIKYTPRKRGHTQTQIITTHVRFYSMEESERADGAPSKRAAFMVLSSRTQKTSDKDQNQEGGAVAARLLSGDAKPSWPPSESAG